MQLKVEVVCGGNLELKKSIIFYELVLNNFKMVGEKNWLYEEVQLDIEYEIEMVGDKIWMGIDDVKVDWL